MLQNCKHGDKLKVIKGDDTYDAFFVSFIETEPCGEQAIICTLDLIGRPTPRICSVSGILQSELGGLVTPASVAE